MLHFARALAVLLPVPLALSAAPTAPAQTTPCAGTWTRGQTATVDAYVGLGACVEFDDGSGPKLHAVGRYYWSNTDGSFLGNGERIHGVGVLEDGTWQPLTTSGAPTYRDLCVHDDGSGPALFALEQPPFASNPVVRWTGTDWAPVPGLANADFYGIQGIESVSTPSGQRLIAFGSVDSSAGASFDGLAVFDGNGWSPLTDTLGRATGVLPNAFSDRPVRDVVGVPNASGGHDLVIVGDFHSVIDPATGAAIAMPHVARWDGDQWHGYGTALDLGNGEVHAVAMFDDGTGPTLVIGGRFSTTGTAPARSLAVWNGTSWDEFAGGVNDSVVFPSVLTPTVHALVPCDLGSGPVLAVCGDFDTAGGTLSAGIAIREPGAWLDTDGGVRGARPQVHCRTATVLGASSATPRLAVVGTFDTLGTTVTPSIAEWDGNAWTSPVDVDPDRAQFGWFETLDLGAGPQLFGFNGAFAGTDPIGGVGVWTGTGWAPFGPLDAFRNGRGIVGGIRDALVFDDGSGPALYVALWERLEFGSGIATGVVRRTGSSWEQVGAGLAGSVDRLLIHDAGSGPELYAFGPFHHSGAAEVAGAARWDGAQWHQVGDGLGPAQCVEVCSVDLGAGPEIIAVGPIFNSGSAPLTPPVRWDGASWQSIPQIGGQQYGGMRKVDFGTGPRVIFAGKPHYPHPDGGAARGIASWDGTSIERLGNGLDLGSASDLHTLDLETVTGSAGETLLAVAGAFVSAGPHSVDGFALWNGSEWIQGPSSLEQDIAPWSLTLVEGVSGVTGQLLVRGEMRNPPWPNASIFHANEIAVGTWSACGTTSVGADYCTATSNSTGQAGQLDALLFAGNAPHTLHLEATSVPPRQLFAMLVSRQQTFVPMVRGQAANLCVGGTIGFSIGVGQPVVTTPAGTARIEIDLTSIPQGGGTVAAQAGETWNFQGWHRDSGGTFNLTRGLEAQF